MINITTYENASQVRFDIEAKKMFSNNKVELIKLILKPGEEIGLHKNPFDVIFYVVFGKGVLTVESESIQVLANSTVFVDQNSLRGWKNNSENLLELLVVKLIGN